MEKLKEALARIAPFVICWAMGLVTYYMASHTEKALEALIAIVGIFN